MPSLNLPGRAPESPQALEDVAILLHPDDDVAIAKNAILPGTIVLIDGRPYRAARVIPPGHKLARRVKTPGQTIKRYGQVIGFATQAIQPADHVHSHNLAAGSQGGLRLDYAVATEALPPESTANPRTFRGFRRPDGRAGTRNYVAVLASVNCSSSAVRAIAEHFREPQTRADYPNVDGVIALAVKGGCGAHYGSPYLAQLQRTLAGTVDHPNVGGYLVVSLGCEVNQPQDLAETGALDKPTVLTIQEQGGFRQTVRAGIAAVERILPMANDASREEISASELVVALQCGGSDSWSGVTANPALGKASDEIVRQGGTVVLAETTEVYGAEHLLTRRAATPQVAQDLLDRIHWWERYTAKFDASIDNNPAPGNKVGGLTTIYEKSLGAVAKAGATRLNGVFGYGERIESRGFVHMDTPGYDPVSVTGQVAGGCNVVCFTTGRGSAFGYKPAPSIKIASNSELYRRQKDDMDIDAGRILAGAPLEEIGEEIFERILAVASGARTKSEEAGLGEEEFNPWILGAVL